MPDDSSSPSAGYACVLSSIMLASDSELPVVGSSLSSLTPVQLLKPFAAESACCRKCWTDGFCDCSRASLAVKYVPRVRA